jgi:hypothetical protein
MSAVLKTPGFTKPFHLAKWVAGQIHKFPGYSARQLYQEYLAEFAEFAMDAGPASALIQQHLRKLEEDGMVVAVKGATKGGPMHWTWVGPEPANDEPATVKDSLTVEPESPLVDFAAVDHDAPVAAPGLPDPEPEPIAAFSHAIRDTSPEPRELTEAEIAELATWRGAFPVPDPDPDLDLGDPWESLARSFAQACREQAAARPYIDDLGLKLHTLERLEDIVAPDIAGVLSGIRHDLGQLGG